MSKKNATNPKNAKSTKPAKKQAGKKQPEPQQLKPEATDADLVPLTELDRQKKPKKERGMSGLDAAARVLKEAGEPLKVSQIVGTMLAAGYWKTNGKTPAATIVSAIIREIRVKGDKSRFKKTARGLFEFNG